MPTLATGKIDAALAVAPRASVRGRAERQERSHLERQLEKVWTRVLRVVRVAPGRQLLEIGGHSLLASELIIESRRNLGWATAFGHGLEAPTIGEMAGIIANGKPAPAGRYWCPSRRSATQLPLYWARPGGWCLGVRPFGPSSGPNRPVYGLQPGGWMAQRSRIAGLEDMAARYVAQFTASTARPVCLGGYLLCGYVAHEMALL